MEREGATIANRTEGVRHTFVITDEDMERIKSDLMAKITDVLPEILVEILPAIIFQILPNIITSIEEKANSHIESKKEAEQVMKNNRAKLNEISK